MSLIKAVAELYQEQAEKALRAQKLTIQMGFKKGYT